MTSSKVKSEMLKLKSKERFARILLKAKPFNITNY